MTSGQKNSQAIDAQQGKDHEVFHRYRKHQGDTPGSGTRDSRRRATNPSLIAKENKPFKEAILEICSTVNGPVSAEVTSLEKDAMMRQGQEYASWHKNVVVKLPTTRKGV